MCIRDRAKDARTEYAIYAVKIKNEFILLNLSQANRIIEEALPKRRFSFLGLRRQIVREKKIGGYKSDLYIEDTKTLIEIKSILSFQKTALFLSLIHIYSLGVFAMTRHGVH